MNRNLLVSIGIACFLTIFSSCVTVAKLSEFPKSSEEIRFSELSLAQNSDGDWSRTLNGHSQYVIYIDSVDENQLLKTISQALVTERYKVISIDSSKNFVIGKRGMTLWEWKSIIGVYYEMGNNGYKIYLKNAITQDITGGFNFNRAQKVGVILCGLLSKCTDSETGILEQK